MLDFDSDLVKRIKKGDEFAFEKIMSRYKKRVFNTVYRFVGNVQEAENLTQEVFLKVYQGIGSFKELSKFSTWLYRITVNLCLNEVKKTNKDSSLLIPLQDYHCSDDTTNFTPYQIAERKDFLDFVKKTIASLPPEQKAVVILYRYEELSYQEIADALDITVSAVKSRLHRARTTLKDQINCYWQTAKKDEVTEKCLVRK